MKNAPLYILLIFLLAVIYIRNTSSFDKDIVPNKPVVIEPEKIPSLKSNIVYDIDEAKKLAKTYKRSIILIFGAQWCGYCQDLKKDIISNSFDTLNHYIICFIDIQNKEDITKEYLIEKIPKAILLADKYDEWSKKVG